MDAEAFWSMYEAHLRASGLHPKAVAWCRKRAAFFIETTKRVRLKEKTSEDIKGYFCKQLASGRLEDWQYAQLVDALRVLFLHGVKAPWAQTFPWEAWKAPQRNFASEIAYVARPGSICTRLTRRSGFATRLQACRSAGGSVSN